MKKLKSNFFFKYMVLLFLPAYLLGSATNMLFIPRYTAAYSKATAANNARPKGFIRHANFHKVNFLKILDKSTIDDDLLNPLRISPKCLLIIFAGFSLLNTKIPPISPHSNIFYNLQHAYITFCTFRI